MFQGIAEYNFGQKSVISTMVRAGITPGSKTAALGQRRNARRNTKMLRIRHQKEFQNRRRALRLENLRREQNLKEKEGPSYGAGAF